MKQYLNLMSDVLANGITKPSRPGINTRSLFGRQLVFDLRRGFPLLTTKSVHTKSMIHELLWMISGDTNVRTLQENGVTIWDEWADANGELGPVYGAQWRGWDNLVDQLADVQDDLRLNPFSRRHIVTAWNPTDVGLAKLPPCHVMFQFDVRMVNGKGRLSCMMTQRSADLFLGVPFNIASYALLTHMMAQTTDYDVGDLIINFGDVHLYENHIEQAALQLTRFPTALPTLVLNPAIDSIFDFTFGDIHILDYHPQGVIKGVVAI